MVISLFLPSRTLTNFTLLSLRFTLIIPNTREITLLCFPHQSGKKKNFIWKGFKGIEHNKKKEALKLRNVPNYIWKVIIQNLEYISPLEQYYKWITSRFTHGGQGGQWRPVKNTKKNFWNSQEVQRLTALVPYVPNYPSEIV